MSSRHFKPEIRVSSLRFSPTGRWQNYSLEHGFKMLSCEHWMMEDNTDVVLHDVDVVRHHSSFSCCLLFPLRCLNLVQQTSLDSSRHVYEACMKSMRPVTDELCRPVSQVVLLLLRSQLGGHHHWGPAGLLPWRVTGLRPVRPGPRRDTGQHTQTAAPSGVGVGHSPGVQTQRKSSQAGSVGEGPTWTEWVNFTLFNILSSLFHLETPEWCELCVLLA